MWDLSNFDQQERTLFPEATSNNVDLGQGTELTDATSASPERLWNVPQNDMSPRGINEFINSISENRKDEHKDRFGLPLEVAQHPNLLYPPNDKGVELQFMGGKYFSQLPIVTGSTAQFPVGAWAAQNADKPTVTDKIAQGILKSMTAPKAWSPYNEKVSEYTQKHVVGGFDELTDKYGADVYRVLSKPKTKSEVADAQNYYKALQGVKDMADMSVTLGKWTEKVQTLGQKKAIDLSDPIYKEINYVKNELPNEDIDESEMFKKLRGSYSKIDAGLNMYQAVDDAIAGNQAPVEDAIKQAYLQLSDGTKQSAGANVQAITQQLMKADNPELQSWLENISSSIAGNYSNLMRGVSDEERKQKIKEAVLNRYAPRDLVKYVHYPYTQNRLNYGAQQEEKWDIQPMNVDEMMALPVSMDSGAKALLGKAISRKGAIIAKIGGGENPTVELKKGSDIANGVVKYFINAGTEEKPNIKFLAETVSEKSAKVGSSTYDNLVREGYNSPLSATDEKEQQGKPVLLTKKGGYKSYDLSDNSFNIARLKIAMPGFVEKLKSQYPNLNIESSGKTSVKKTITKGEAKEEPKVAAIPSVDLGEYATYARHKK